MGSTGWGAVAGALRRLAVREGPGLLRELRRSRGSSGPAPSGQRPSSGRAGSGQPPAASRTAPVATPGPPPGRHLSYAPQLDGQADPGEVVWTWVVYEEDPAQGKDRPVLVVGRSGDVLLGLMLSSQQERDGQPNWLALGTGAWDGEHRPSWVRLDRVLRVDEAGIRREGAVLERSRFDAVAAALRGGYGWD